MGTMTDTRTTSTYPAAGPPIDGVPHSHGLGYCAMPVVVTPTLAQTWLDKHNRGNRSLTPSRVAAYAEAISANRFVQDGNAITFDWNQRLINGQHRLEAVVLAGRPVSMLVAVNADPAGFATTDTGKVRDAKDILSIVDVGGSYHREIGSLARLVYQYQHDLLLSTPSMPHADLLLLFDQLGPELRAACEAARRAHNYLGGSKAALAFAFWVINRANPQGARHFYRVWSEGIGRRENDPAQVLFSWWARNRNANTVVRAAVIIKAYNAWATGATPQILSWKRGGIEQFPVAVPGAR